MGKLSNDVASLAATMAKVASRPPPPPPPATGAMSGAEVRGAAGKAAVLIQRLCSRADVAVMFSELDTNGDGLVTHDELRAGFDGIGVSVSDAELHTIIAAGDIDGNGTIDLSEFVEMSRLAKDMARLQELIVRSHRPLNNQLVTWLMPGLSTIPRCMSLHCVLSKLQL